MAWEEYSSWLLNDFVLSVWEERKVRFLRQQKYTAQYRKKVRRNPITSCPCSNMSEFGLGVMY